MKVGFLVPNLQSERYQREQALFTNKINELGGEALVASAEYDDKLQIDQASKMIKEGAKVLVVNSVNMNTAAAIVREAHENNVKVIAYDRVIQNCDLDIFISFDNVKVGKLMAEYTTRIKPEGNYVLIGGDKADLNAVLVKSGQLEVLEALVKNGKIKIIYNVYVEDWSGENAYQEMKRFLNLSEVKPDVILSSYDGMSLGCIKALDDHGLAGQVIITGQDAELEACRNIIQNRQTMTVYKPLKLLAENAAELSFKMAKGDKLSLPSTTIENGQKSVPAILLEPVAVDKENMKNKIIAEGFYTEAQVYN
ncbi:MAG: sugar ABC transporter substrate-binding protein [Bacteroidetes bacterium]|nr:sugar ABC transporter substrate-binding protein [Bacteroidota bacterium]